MFSEEVNLLKIEIASHFGQIWPALSMWVNIILICKIFSLLSDLIITDERQNIMFLIFCITGDQPRLFFPKRQLSGRGGTDLHFEFTDLFPTD